jgi:hypothetical protein
MISMYKGPREDGRRGNKSEHVVCLPPTWFTLVDINLRAGPWSPFLSFVHEQLHVHVYVQRQMNNDQVEQFALVYHPAATPSQSQQLLTDAPMSDTLWHHPAHQSPSVASPSSPFQSQFNRSDHSGYPSSPPFTQHGSPGSTADFSSPSDASPLGSDSHFSQIESTVGPSRSPPRRHRVHLAGLHLSTRPDNPASPDETGGNAEVCATPSTSLAPFLM